MQIVPCLIQWLSRHLERNFPIMSTSFTEQGIRKYIIAVGTVNLLSQLELSIWLGFQITHQNQRKSLKKMQMQSLPCHSFYIPAHLFAT